jgi:predicted nucleic acid-binding protein
VRRFVIDASVVLSWLLPDENAEATSEIKARFSDSEFCAPAHWKLEIANALVVAERRGRLVEASVLEAIQLVSALPVTVDDTADNKAITSTLSLARQHKLSCYDAAYLELSIRLGATLCTLDKDLENACLRVGLQFTPQR